MGVKEYRDITDNKCFYDKKNKKPLVSELCLKSIIYKRKTQFWDRIIN